MRHSYKCKAFHSLALCWDSPSSTRGPQSRQCCCGQTSPCHTHVNSCCAAPAPGSLEESSFTSGLGPAFWVSLGARGQDVHPTLPCSLCPAWRGLGQLPHSSELGCRWVQVRRPWGWDVSGRTVPTNRLSHLCGLAGAQWLSSRCARHSGLFLELLTLLTTVLGPNQERRWASGRGGDFPGLPAGRVKAGT